MDNREIVEQMIDFHKKSFENCFLLMASIQNQTEKIFKSFVEQTPGISKEMIKVMDEWNAAYKQGIEDFKKTMDKGYAKVEDFLDNNAILTFQEQTEKMFNAFSNQRSFTPYDYMKDMMNEWFNMFSKNMKSVGDIFSLNNKQQKKKERKK